MTPTCPDGCGLDDIARDVPFYPGEGVILHIRFGALSPGSRSRRLTSTFRVGAHLARRRLRLNPSTLRDSTTYEPGRGRRKQDKDTSASLPSGKRGKNANGITPGTNLWIC